MAAAGAASFCSDNCRKRFSAFDRLLSANLSNSASVASIGLRRSSSSLPVAKRIYRSKLHAADQIVAIEVLEDHIEELGLSHRRFHRQIAFHVRIALQAVPVLPRRQMARRRICRSTSANDAFQHPRAPCDDDIAAARFELVGSEALLRQACGIGARAQRLAELGGQRFAVRRREGLAYQCGLVFSFLFVFGSAPAGEAALAAAMTRWFGG